MRRTLFTGLLLAVLLLLFAGSGTAIARLLPVTLLLLLATRTFAGRFGLTLAVLALLLVSVLCHLITAGAWPRRRITLL